MKNDNYGFGLFGLLITFGVIILMLWYSLDLLHPGPRLGEPEVSGVEIPTSVSGQIDVIESAKQAKNLVESQSQKSAQPLAE